MIKFELVEDEYDYYSCENCVFRNKENFCILGLIENAKGIRLLAPCIHGHYELNFGGKDEL